MLSAKAQIFIGSGATIGPSQTTNFTQIVQVGTFNLTPLSITFGYNTNSVTNSALFAAYGRLTFDGTNFFYPGQYWSPTNGLIWNTTNQSIPIYAALSVTNGQLQAITNVTAHN